MNWKKLGKSLLFPHIAIMMALLPIATVFLVFSMIYIGTKTVPAYISYILATYTLTIWCMKIPKLIRFFKRFKNENKYVRRWLTDTYLRTNITLHGSFLWNVAYAVMQLGLGFIHSTFWFYSLAGYYLCLALMRFYLVRYISKHRPGEEMKMELIRYRTCGWIFLLMNMTLTVIIFFMVYWNRTFEHHEITAITLAAYTFTSFTMAIINMVKYRKYNSPVLSAGKAINLAAACVSMLTLESTLLTTFRDGSMDITFQRIMLAATGAVISIFIIILAIYMIVQSNRKLKLLQKAESREELYGTGRKKSI